MLEYFITRTTISLKLVVHVCLYKLMGAGHIVAMSSSTAVALYHGFSLCMNNILFLKVQESTGINLLSPNNKYFLGPFIVWWRGN